MFFLPDMTQFAADFRTFIMEDLIDMHTLGALERSGIAIVKFESRIITYIIMYHTHSYI